MKKVLCVFALLLPLTAVLAVEVSRTPVPVADNPWNLSESGLMEVVELAYDEALPVNFGFKMSTGDRMAVMFTPDGDFAVQEACYVPIGWADDPDNWDAECKLVFFDEAPSGEPGSSLGDKDVSAYEQGNFNWFDVSDLNITIEDGENFFFGVENLVDDNPGLALDGGAPPNHRSWMYTTFVGEPEPFWSPFDNIGLPPPWPEDLPLGDSVDLILRVRGDLQPIGVVELEPTIVKFAPTATLVVSSGSLSYTLAAAGNVDITLYDASGRPVKTLFAGYADAGEHSLIWDGSDLARGTYFARLHTSSYSVVSKIVLID